MLMEAARGRELPLGGINPRGLQVTGRRSRAEKTGRTDKGNGRHRHTEWESRGQERPGWQVEYSKVGKHRDEQWRLTGEENVYVDSLSDPGIVGGNKQVQQSGVKW